MSRIPQARAILQRVHDRLLDRLCELLIENEDELLRDEEWSGTQTELSEIAEKLRVASVTLGFMPNAQPVTPQGSPTNPETSVVVVGAMPFFNLGDFLYYLKNGETLKASLVLSTILQITEERAVECTRAFIDRVKHDMEAVPRLQTLAKTIRTNEGRRILSDLFGFTDREAASIQNILTQ